MNDKILETFLRESNAIEEVYDDKSLLDARFAWEYLIRQAELTPEVVCETHRRLMRSQRLPKSLKGRFRPMFVRVGWRICPDPREVPRLMQNWFAKVNNDVTWRDIQSSHVEFERIHPFADGNGRTGRMFMNWQRLLKGLPILIIYETEKHNYYRWFEEVSI